MADAAIRKRGPDDLLQIRVWITQAKYDQLKLRAHHHDSSVAAEVRALIVAGEQRFDEIEQLERKLDSVMNYLTSHLEPLAFIAAMDAAKSAEYWRNEVRASMLNSSGDAEEAVRAADRIVGERATKRIQRGLRGLRDGDDENDGT